MVTVKDVVVRKPSEQEIQACRDWDTWQCGVSEFDWEYSDTETCLILEGQVTVRDPGDAGHSIRFGPGDLVVFPAGLQCVWQVTEPVKKHYRFG